MNDEEMVCEKCGAEMVHRINGSNYIIECPKCGWGCVTTYTEPIYADRTIYTISILPRNSVTKTVLSAIGKVAGVNFLGAKPIAEQGRADVFEALAPEIREKKKLLDDAGVSHLIEPEFPY